MTIRTFRLLLIAWLTLGAAAVLSTNLTTHLLPTLLQDYRQGTIQTIPVRNLIVASIVGPAGVATLIGLWRLRSWGRSLSLIFMFLRLALPPFLGPVVESGVTYAFLSAENALLGLLIGLSYWSALSQHFDSRAAA